MWDNFEILEDQGDGSIKPRMGWKHVAAFEGVVQEAKFTKGRLLARVNDMWHIVPLSQAPTKDKAE
jgi:hypothetical protein